ncbi:MAG: Fic family protein [Chitinophagaceae bacterium]|nr:Fic family protein [Chitinophagaceae bacterium]
MFIHELKGWPAFEWDDHHITTLLARVRHRQGLLCGRMSALGFDLRQEAALRSLTLEVVKSNEIEGELLDKALVRSSIARRLGMDIAGLLPADRTVEGIVEMMLDATRHYDQTLTDDRLFAWHATLFPTGRSGLYKITTGQWRDGHNGAMQVVSGPMGREQVHFTAPDAHRLAAEMSAFLHWFNTPSSHDPVLRAAVAHLWFITIHPFDDGNGRIARAITDMQLARADGDPQRFYSMSVQIEKEKQAYYNILERTQRGTLNITDWMVWFLECLEGALQQAEVTLASVLKRAAFMDRIAGIVLNERQQHMILRLTDDFFGRLTSSKWAKLTKCSQDTALRDIQDLMQKGIVTKDDMGGRSTGYVLKDF